MKKIANRLFLTQFIVLLASFILLKLIFKGFPLSFWLLLIIAALLSFVLTLIVSQLLVKPVQQIQKVTEKITQGDFKDRLPLRRRDELGSLASNLNQLSTELQNKILEIMRDKNELKAILSNMVEGVIVIGPDEKIVLLSSPVAAMLELRSQETLGKPYWEVIRHEQINLSIQEVLEKKKSLKKEITIYAPSESHFSMQISCVLLDSQELIGLVAVFHDITELKSLAKIRSEFVANVSHELKTPLTTIKGFVETLKEGALNDPDKAKKFLDIIQTHTQRLEYLVNDLLTLSAIESKGETLQLEKISLSSVINPVLHLFKDRLENKHLRLSLDISQNLGDLNLDRIKMEQVFLNLLDNAIKFTPSGGNLSIQAHHEQEFVRIDIKDTGIGIEQKHLPHLFERFYRVDKGRSRELGGTGLGLSIVKHIMQMHAGRVTVASTPGQGSVFSIFLPMGVF